MNQPGRKAPRPDGRDAGRKDGRDRGREGRFAGWTTGRLAGWTAGRFAGWTAGRFAALAVTATACVLLFGPTARDLVGDWLHSGEYGHGLLFLPLALWLAWRRRLPSATPGRAAGLAVLAGAVLLFLVGSVAAEFFIRRLAMLGAAAGLVLYYRGPGQLRAWWLSFALLLTTIPLPEVVLSSLTLPLQLLASQAAVAALQFRHVPAELAGNVILLPGHELFVAEACSGLRSLSALLGLALLFGGTGLQRPGARIALLVLAIPAALAANALRVFVTGWAVHLWGPAAAEGMLHESTGALVFLLALAAVGGTTLLLRRWGTGGGEPGGRSGGGAPSLRRRVQVRGVET